MLSMRSQCVENPTLSRTSDKCVLPSVWLEQVVVGVLDPNPLVGGQGLQTLKDNSIQTDVGCLEDECYGINRDFMERMEVITAL